MKSVFAFALLTLSLGTFADVTRFDCTDSESGEKIKVQTTSGFFRPDRTSVIFDDGEKVHFPNNYRNVTDPVLYQKGRINDVIAEGSFRNHSISKTKGALGGKNFNWNLYIENKLFTDKRGKIHYTYFYSQKSLIAAVVFGQARIGDSASIRDMDCTLVE